MHRRCRTEGPPRSWTSHFGGEWLVHGGWEPKRRWFSWTEVMWSYLSGVFVLIDLFIFTPVWGNDPTGLLFFWDGLKAPTSCSQFLLTTSWSIPVLLSFKEWRDKLISLDISNFPSYEREASLFGARLVTSGLFSLLDLDKFDGASILFMDLHGIILFGIWAITPHIYRGQLNKVFR